MAKAFTASWWNSPVAARLARTITAPNLYPTNARQGELDGIFYKEIKSMEDLSSQRASRSSSE